VTDRELLELAPNHTARCTDCHEPTGPVVVCEACSTARCESVAAAQRKRDAEICRQIHSTSRQRVELALLCAGAIEGAGQCPTLITC